MSAASSSHSQNVSTPDCKKLGRLPAFGGIEANLLTEHNHHSNAVGGGQCYWAPACGERQYRGRTKVESNFFSGEVCVEND